MKFQHLTEVVLKFKIDYESVKVEGVPLEFNATYHLNPRRALGLVDS